MIESQISRGPAFQWFARFVVGIAILLVWWGAATTTKQAGMVFADWPLSLGTVNPPGWLEHMIPFLEHSHRLLAKLVGVLVLVLFSWAYVRNGRRALEVAGIVVLLAVVLGFYIAAGSERFDVMAKQRLLLIAAGLSILPVGWLVWSWRSRGWDPVQKLTALALLMVTTQAIFGGLRVTEISNAFAVIHGCFAQCFFCVLILIVMVSAPGWRNAGFTVSRELLGRSRKAGVLLVGLVLMQLIFGASMRHFHRHALPDDGLFLTQGRWIPSFEDPMIAMLFLHKFTAFSVFFFVLGMALTLGGGTGNPALRRLSTPGRHALAILILLCLQISLGLLVIGTSKSFWVTNVHVLNGLVILALSFVFAVRAIRGRDVDGLQAVS
ncbi:MAG: COX15/CtaA family protein [Verrucomicrobiae bacterium]|nr:COX15/CtaA family protein [Verrucomicrobiae bacterium]